MKILERRKKSIRSRLIIDFGLILIGICIVNYVAVSFIYSRMLYKEKVTQTKIIANAATTKAQSIIKDSSNMMDNITRIRYLQDVEISLDDVIEKLYDYTWPFYDIAVIDLDGYGRSIEGRRFNVEGNQVIEKAFNGEFNTVEILEIKENPYLVFIRPIKGENDQIQAIAIGARRVEDFFKEIMTVSSGKMCFIADCSGTGFMGSKDNEGNITIYKLIEDAGTKSLFESQLLYGKKYNKKIKDQESDQIINFNYELIDDSEWLLGVINGTGPTDIEVTKFKCALINGMIIAIIIGVITVYYIADSLVKRLQDIANYLSTSIKDEFKHSVPKELLENEDEIGTIAREMKYLEEEMLEMLDNIKESIDYLNDKVKD